MAAPPTRPPASIQVEQALSKAPAKGKKVIFLQCELPACARYVPGINAATTALGWSAKTEVFKNADPGGALQQAINEHPDYIAITGIPAAALKPQLAAARKAGIPVISCATPDKPTAGGYSVQCGGTLATDADYVARWVINDSGGKGHLVALTIPQFPVLNTETDWLKANLKRLCAGCSLDQLDLTIDDVAGGQVASKLIAFVQSHPNVNYVYFTFNDLSRGVPAALKAAGFGGKVKLVGAAGDAAIMKTIGSGQNAWTIAPERVLRVGHGRCHGAARDGRAAERGLHEQGVRLADLGRRQRRLGEAPRTDELRLVRPGRLPAEVQGAVERRRLTQR